MSTDFNRVNRVSSKFNSIFFTIPNFPIIFSVNLKYFLLRFLFPTDVVVFFSSNRSQIVLQSLIFFLTTSNHNIWSVIISRAFNYFSSQLRQSWQAKHILVVLVHRLFRFFNELDPPYSMVLVHVSSLLLTN